MDVGTLEEQAVKRLMDAGALHTNAPLPQQPKHPNDNRQHPCTAYFGDASNPDDLVCVQGRSFREVLGSAVVQGLVAL